jgi:hypothetical protein
MENIMISSFLIHAVLDAGLIMICSYFSIVAYESLKADFVIVKQKLEKLETQGINQVTRIVPRIDKSV